MFRTKTFRFTGTDFPDAEVSRWLDDLASNGDVVTIRHSIPIVLPLQPGCDPQLAAVVIAEVGR